MKLYKALVWLPALLVLGGCPDGGETPPPPPPPPEERVLSQVTVSCLPASVVLGGSTQCSAVALDQHGASLEVPGFTWNSSNEAVAKVDTAGKVTSAAVGTTTVRASATLKEVTKQGETSFSVSPRPETLHAAPITANEMWLAANNPHVVSGQLTVDQGATLTLEAGAEVRFAQDAELRLVNGSLKALGTQQAPVQLVAHNATTAGFWRGVVFATEGSGSQLSHVTLSHCGREPLQACVRVSNKATPVLQDVTVRDSAGAGVKVEDDGSAFGSGSARLTVSSSAGYAVRMGANQAGTLPADSAFTDNGHDNAVELSGKVSRTQTWPRQVYDIIGTIDVSSDDIENRTRIKLTLSAGTVLRFAANGELAVALTRVGDLVVDGSQEQPIRFTSKSAQPGSWKGVHLLPDTSSETRISHAIIEYAGAEASAGTGRANLNLYRASPTLNDLVLRKGSHQGLAIPDAGFDVPASWSQLTVSDNGGYAISTQANMVGALPATTTFSRNGKNAIEVNGHVITTQTWPNLGVPYVVPTYVNVGYISQATLTLLPGTEVQFAKNSEFTIGAVADWRQGALVAKGTAEAPIRFVPNEPATNFFWGGIHFLFGTGSRLDHVFVSYGGTTTRRLTGNINVYQEIGPFITNTRSTSGICGIYVSRYNFEGSTVVTTDFSLPEYNNNIAGNAEPKVCTEI